MSIIEFQPNDKGGKGKVLIKKCKIFLLLRNRISEYEVVPMSHGPGIPKTIAVSNIHDDDLDQVLALVHEARFQGGTVQLRATIIDGVRVDIRI